MQRKPPPQPVYAYIARAYGLTFKPGDVVTLDEYGGIEGRVMRSQGDPQYVRVEWTPPGTMKRRQGDFHPQSITRQTASVAPC